jgi:thiol-disulfide isomerase/thioredoxin
VLLLFVNPHCGPCQALLPEVARWQTDYASALTIAIVSEGSAAANRDKKIPGLERILLQREREVAGAYHSYGTPGAVLIDDGRIISDVAQGAVDIRALVTDFFDGRPRRALIAGDAIPEVTLETAAGTAIALRDVVRTSDETVLLFWSPGCGFCSNMLDDLRAWERGRSERDAQLAIVSSAAMDADASGLTSLVLLDPRRYAASAFGAQGTPMAVRVDARGYLASNVVAGRTAVLELLSAREVSFQ